MTGSLLELIGALFLATLPLYILVMRARRRRRRQAAAAARSETSDGRDTTPPAEGRKKPAGPEGRGAASRRRGTTSEVRSNFEESDGAGYRPLAGTSVTPVSTAPALLQRLYRYPPLQRAIVLKELLGRPKGLDDDEGRRSPVS